MTAQFVYLLQNTDASFSVSTEEEFVDHIEIASLDEAVVDTYIAEHKISLGKSHLYHSNYEYYTKKKIPLTVGANNAK